jgi:cob(I)alamin adenosyltransferase
MRKKYPSAGDHGESRLVSGQMASKDHANFEAVGTLDELASVLGWAKCACEDAELKDGITWVQGKLLELGSCITGWSAEEFSEKPICKLEEDLAAWQKEMPDLKVFILPDGVELAMRFHIARTVCRRAERKVAMLIAKSARKPTENVTRFINRLSDWLYVAARLTNFRAGRAETVWEKDKNSAECEVLSAKKR